MVKTGDPVVFIYKGGINGKTHKKGGDKTRRFKITQSLTLGIYAALLKDEYVFEFYMQFIQHSGNLANLNNFSRAVGKTSGLHNNINGRGNHFPDCPDRKLGEIGRASC